MEQRGHSSPIVGGTDGADGCPEPSAGSARARRDISAPRPSSPAELYGWLIGSTRSERGRPRDTQHVARLHRSGPPIGRLGVTCESRPAYGRRKQRSRTRPLEPPVDLRSSREWDHNRVDGDSRRVGLHRGGVELPGDRHGGLRPCLVPFRDDGRCKGSLPGAGLIHDLLLVIILLELFRTIINFLKTKIITREPFLYICIIASTRRILTRELRLPIWKI